MEHRADLILTGGTVLRGVPREAEPPPSGGRGTDAVAVADGRIRAVGPAHAVEALRGPGTRVVRLHGEWILPGFVDAHVHLLPGGLLLSSLDLRDVAGREEFAERVARFVEGLPPGDWVVGGNWEHQRWGGELPRREWIDGAAPHHPVLLARTDMHVAVANSRALERGGIGPGTPDPPGGEIDRDPETGRPTGILRERAIEMVREAVPPPSPRRREGALRKAQAHAFAHGVTQVHDMGVMGVDEETWEGLAALRRGAEEGWLRLRVRSYLPIATRERVRSLVREDGPGDHRLRWDGVKAFVDGSLGAATAWFHEPYVDAPERSGGPISDLGELRHALLEADSWSLQCAVHAIGDRAVDWVLDLQHEMTASHGRRDRRFRVEHAQHLTAGAAARFGAQGVVASVQPAHLREDGRWAEERLGPHRIRRAFACRTLLDGGALLALGSDWTVVPLDPLEALDAATGRRTLDGAHSEGWVPAERISLAEAVRAHTGAASRAGFLDGATGELAPGRCADLVVVSGELPRKGRRPEPPPAVELTMVDGEVVHSRGRIAPVPGEALAR